MLISRRRCHNLAYILQRLTIKQNRQYRLFSPVCQISWKFIRDLPSFKRTQQILFCQVMYKLRKFWQVLQNIFDIFAGIKIRKTWSFEEKQINFVQILKIKKITPSVPTRSPSLTVTMCLWLYDNYAYTESKGGLIEWHWNIRSINRNYRIIIIFPLVLFAKEDDSISSNQK